MKKSFFSFVICALFVAFTSVSFVSCGMGEATLQTAIEEANKQYPQEIGDGITIQNITIEGEDIVYNCTVEGSSISIEAIDMVKDTMQDTILESLKESYSSDKNVKTFVDLAVISGKNIKYTYSDPESGASTSFLIDNATLAAF